MSEFSYASVSFIDRDQNSEAHSLIGLALSCGSRTWFGDLFWHQPLASCFPLFVWMSSVSNEK